MRPMYSLRLRMTALCAVGTSLVLAIMAGVSYRISVEQLHAQWESSFASGVSAVHTRLREQPVISHTWLLQAQAERGTLVGLESAEGYQMTVDRGSPRGELVSRFLQTARDDYGFAAQADSITFLTEEYGAQYRVAVASLKVGKHWLTVVIAGDRNGELEQRARLRDGFAASVAVSVACLLAFAWFFSRWAARPVQESQERQTAFIAAASHEFRSPVAVIQMAAENQKTASPEQAGRFREMILRECGRLSRLTGDMLRLAGADSHGLLLEIAPVGPEIPLLSCHESFSSLAQRKGISLELELPGEPLPPILCDRERVEQVLAVLLSNALEYTPQGGRVTLGLQGRGRKAVYRVADTGPGIPENQRELIFQRFYRGDASRTNKEHFGLGLSVAREIALLHRGTLTVEEAPEGGSVFTLLLPMGAD